MKPKTPLRPQAQNFLGCPLGIPEAWLKHCGGTLDAIELRADGSACGVGVYACRDIGVGELVFAVPQCAILTPEIASEDDLLLMMR